MEEEPGLPNKPVTPIVGPHVPRRWLAWIFLGTAALAAALDLWTKATAEERLKTPTPQPQIEVIPGALGFRYVKNEGIIFGIGKSLSKVFFVVAIVAVPVIGVIFIRLKAPTLCMTLALAFVLGGTIGNLHDRIFFGAVRDFIYFYLIDWPIFNLADSFILSGTILLMLELTLLDDKRSPQGSAVSPQEG